MEIHVCVVYSGSSFTVDVFEDDTVMRLRARIAEGCPFAEPDVRLCVHNDTDTDTEVLPRDSPSTLVCDTGLESGTTLDVVFCNTATLQQIADENLTLGDCPEWVLADVEAMKAVLSIEGPYAVQMLATWAEERTADGPHSDPTDSAPSSMTQRATLSQALLNNPEVMLPAVRSTSSYTLEILKESNSTLLSDVAFIRESLEIDCSALLYAEENVVSDEAFMKEVTSEHGSGVMGFASTELKDDEGFVRHCLGVAMGGNAMREASRRIAADREFVLEALTTTDEEYVADVFRHVDVSLRNDAAVAKVAVQRNGASLEFASSELQDNAELAVLAIKNNIHAAKFCSEALLKSSEFVLKTLHLGCTLYHAHESLTHDRSFMLEAVSIQGASLSYASCEVQEDREVVLAALRENPNSVAHAAAELRRDPVFMKEAVAISGVALRHGTHGVKSCKDVAMAACQQNARAYEFVSASLRGDPEVIAVAEAQNPKAFRFITGNVRALGPRRVFG